MDCRREAYRGNSNNPYNQQNHQKHHDQQRPPFSSSMRQGGELAVSAQSGSTRNARNSFGVYADSTRRIPSVGRHEPYARLSPRGRPGFQRYTEVPFERIECEYRPIQREMPFYSNIRTSPDTFEERESVYGKRARDFEQSLCRSKNFQETSDRHIHERPNKFSRYPSRYKTKMCPDIMCKTSSCKFAHYKHELRCAFFYGNIGCRNEMDCKFVH